MSDREHDLRHAVAFGLACEEIDQWTEDEAAQGWQRHHRRWPKRGLHSGAQHLEEQLREPLDQPAEDEGAQPGADTDDQTCRDQDLRLGGTDALQHTRDARRCTVVGDTGAHAHRPRTVLSVHFGQG